jgi:hypothetical protein
MSAVTRDEKSTWKKDSSGWWKRFLVKTTRDSETGCLLWTGGYSDKKGYGRFSLGGRPIYARHAAFFHEYGYWPEGYVVNTCTTRGCVEGKHLKEQDYGYELPRPDPKKKVAPANVKVGPEAAAEMRRLWDAGWTAEKIGLAFGVNQSTAHRTAHGDFWNENGTGIREDN